MNMLSIKNFFATTTHKFWVLFYIIKTCIALLKRGLVHDLSKYSSYEEPFFSKYLPKLKSSVYQSPEYNKFLEEMKPAIKHHYANNTHHPEHYGSIEEMCILDQIEMLCDWRAACRRHNNGNVIESIEKNQKRFNYSDKIKSKYLRFCKEVGLIKSRTGVAHPHSTQN